MHRIGKWFLSAWLLLAGSIVVLPADAGACSCAESPPLSEDVANAAAVFSGTVVEIDEPDRGPGTTWSSADPVHVRFAVDASWKGVDTTQVVVSTAVSGESCGYERFELGRAYVVFAHGSSEHLETGLCTRTAPLDEASDIVAGLGEGRTPTIKAELSLQAPGEAAPPGDVDGDERTDAWIYGAAAAAVVALAALLVFRRSRRS